MTREEAMDLLDNLIGMVEDSQDNDYDEALKMGIKALERTSNAFPTHECVDPTHECVEMINREAALDAISTFGNREYRRKQGTLRDAYKLISALPYEHVGNSEQLRPKGEWIDMNGPETFPFWQRYKCSVCGERADMSNYCPRCGSRMRGEQNE